MALEDGDWAKADSFFEDVLNNENLEPLSMCSEILKIAKEKGSTDDKSIIIIYK
jgi:hypothetical protein